jgi:hypothetical protein
MLFIASFVLDPDAATWDWEIGIELAQEDLLRFRSNAAIRELDSLKPEDAGKAREALLSIIERSTEPLELKVEVHRERAHIDAGLAADRLPFDDTAGGERLRRYELASSRAISRSLDKMLRLVRGPLAVVSCVDETIAEQDAPNEATELVRGPVSVVSNNEAETIAEQDAPSEATAGPEDNTDEASAPWSTDENPSRVTVAPIGSQLLDGFVSTGRPNDGNCIEPSSGVGLWDDDELGSELAGQSGEEWFKQAIASAAAIDEEELRDLNERMRQVMENAEPARRSCAGATKNHKPGVRAKRSAARNKQRTKKKVRTKQASSTA